VGISILHRAPKNVKRETAPGDLMEYHVP